MIKLTQKALKTAIAESSEDLQIVELYDRFGSGEDIGITLKDDFDGTTHHFQLRSGRILNWNGGNSIDLEEEAGEAQNADDLARNILYTCGLY